MKHRRGVDFREGVDETLGRSARALSLLHGVDNPRQGRIVRRRGYRVFQRTGLVDGAGEHLSPMVFSTGRLSPVIGA